jgi:hypothetical protein
MLEQQPDDIKVRTVICPVQTRLTIVVANRRIHPAIEQEFGGGRLPHPQVYRNAESTCFGSRRVAPLSSK